MIGIIIAAAVVATGVVILIRSINKAVEDILNLSNDYYEEDDLFDVSGIGSDCE